MKHTPEPTPQLRRSGLGRRLRERTRALSALVEEALPKPKAKAKVKAAAASKWEDLSNAQNVHSTFCKFLLVSDWLTDNFKICNDHVFLHSITFPIIFKL